MTHATTRSEPPPRRTVEPHGLAGALSAAVLLLAAAACTEPPDEGADDATVDVDSSGETDADVPGELPNEDAGGEEGAACPGERICPVPPAGCCAEGTVCEDGACRIACPAGSARCGAADDICCAGGELCLRDVCVAPGVPCTVDAECAVAEYCEPVIGRCLDEATSAACNYRPPAGEFDPEIEWYWEAPPGQMVLGGPVVGPVTPDGMPDVVVTVIPAPGSDPPGGLYSGALYVLAGDSGIEELVVTDPPICGWAHPALADLEGDGTVEILVMGDDPYMPDVCNDAVLMAIRPDGTVAWRSHNPDGSRFAVGGNGGPSVADLDDDGRAEVILGATVFSSDGTVRWSRSLTAGSRYNSPLTAIADLDEDGSLEIVAANKAWRANGFPMWENPLLVDGWVAVASLTVAGLPDVVSISNNNLYVLDPLTGAVRRGPVNLPNGAGPPVIADFDGDDRAEIGTVMQGRLTTEAAYVAIDFDDPDGVRWSTPVQDESAAFTASSVFDFDGDGRAEVVYNDECYLDVLDGPTGVPLLRLPNQNTTALPYALVADVDADGNAEIVAPVHTAPHVAYCREPAPGAIANGVRVYGDRMDNWVATRPIWNQHTYHGTNVNDDGTVPGRESRWWEDENSFRRNVQPHPFLAPDLLADGVAADGTLCPTRLTLAVTVSNEGSVGAPAGVPVAAYLLEDTGPRWVGVGRTTEPIVPGGAAVARIVIESPPSDPVRTFDFEVVVDDDGTGTGEHNECDESNNRGGIDGVACRPPG